MSCDNDRARREEAKKEKIRKKTLNGVPFDFNNLSQCVRTRRDERRLRTLRQELVDGQKKGTPDNSWLIVIDMKFWGSADAWRLTSGSL